MKRQKLFWFLMLLFGVAIIWLVIQHANVTHSDEYLVDIGLPQSPKGEQLVRHSAFTLSYSELHEQARWVMYSINKSRLGGNEERSDRFAADPAVLTGSAVDSDYKKSGYDRGHLAPAADMSWSAQAMKESFLFSNISPQLPAFNRGIWKKLEESVRRWAKQCDSVIVVTGPVFADSIGVLGANRITIPSAYYKILLMFRGNDIIPAAFLIPNEKLEQEIASFVVSIDNLEEITHIDFFPGLPNVLETEVEANECTLLDDIVTHPVFRFKAAS